MSTSQVGDLMALALVRRLLLEMGFETQPDGLGTEGMAVGALEVWIHTRHPGLEGKTPLQALQEPQSEQQVRLLLADMARRSEAARGSQQGLSPGDEQAGRGSSG